MPETETAQPLTKRAELAFYTRLPRWCRWLTRDAVTATELLLTIDADLQAEPPDYRAELVYEALRAGNVLALAIRVGYAMTLDRTV